jgi:hypothetical protein
VEPPAEQLARQLELSHAQPTDEENRLVELSIQVKPDIVD